MAINSTLNISFGAKLRGDEYKNSYGFFSNYNGKKPDEFIIQRLNKLSQTKNKPTVFDIGAGQGRNSLPIAGQGFNVCSFEISPEGRKSLLEDAIKSNIQDKITICANNILDNIRPKNGAKADFAFMSHVSQHLNIYELHTLFKNIHSSMAKGGEFIMDALVRKNEQFKDYEKAPFSIRLKGMTLEQYGAASFKEEDILKAAKFAGFKFVKKAPFKEASGRVWYEKQNLWGGFSLLDFLQGVKHYPVELKWFVFKK